MFKNILVPLDGSRLAEVVLPIVSHLSRVLEAAVVLVHVIESDAPDNIHGDHHLKAKEEAFKYLAKIAAESFSPGIKINQHVHSEMVNNVAASIVAHSGEFAPDLIVLCSHGKGGWRDFTVGSIAQQVIGQGRTPVLLIQPRSGATQHYSFDPMIVALDGKPEHEWGLLPMAGDLAIKLGAQMRLVTIIPTLGTLKGENAAAGKLLPGTARLMLEMREIEAAEHLQTEAQLLQAGGISMSWSVVRGDPVQQIRVLADNCHAGLIVLGTHGKAGMKAFWAGSVASKVISTTAIPLLLVPAGR